MHATSAALHTAARSSVPHERNRVVDPTARNLPRCRLPHGQPGLGRIGASSSAMPINNPAQTTVAHERSTSQVPGQPAHQNRQICRCAARYFSQPLPRCSFTHGSVDQAQRAWRSRLLISLAIGLWSLASNPRLDEEFHSARWLVFSVSPKSAAWACLHSQVRWLRYGAPRLVLNRRGETEVGPCWPSLPFSSLRNSASSFLRPT